MEDFSCMIPIRTHGHAWNFQLFCISIKGIAKLKMQSQVLGRVYVFSPALEIIVREKTYPAQCRTENIHRFANA